MKYFIDTANPKDIDSVLTKMTRSVYREHFTAFSGVTTNPNAFSKIGVTTFPGMISALEDIKAVLETHNSYEPEIHVQIPTSTLNGVEAQRFIHKLKEHFDYSNLVIKANPSFDRLLNLHLLQTEFKFNVTGLASIIYCMTALQSAYEVKYASLIPGRMEEFDINSRPHLEMWKKLSAQFAIQRKYVIAGSMRTVEGVMSSIDAGMLPTIGSKVWEMMTDEDCAEMYTNIITIQRKNYHYSESVHDFAVACDMAYDMRSRDLTESFFDTMDKLGQPIWDSMKDL